MKDIRFDGVFDICKFRTPYMETIINNVLNRIGKSEDLSEKGFGSLYEGPTFSDEAGEVTEDGDIYLDANKLKQYDYEVAMALIAHEFAHLYLDHHRQDPGTLQHEYEADELAKKWGFAVDKFRKICGPPTAKA